MCYSVFRLISSYTKWYILNPITDKWIQKGQHILHWMNATINWSIIWWIKNKLSSNEFNKNMFYFLYQTEKYYAERLLWFLYLDCEWKVIKLATISSTIVFITASFNKMQFRFSPYVLNLIIIRLKLIIGNYDTLYKRVNVFTYPCVAVNFRGILLCHQRCYSQHWKLIVNTDFWHLKFLK